jgi:hypothetical protein
MGPKFECVVDVKGTVDMVICTEGRDTSCRADEWMIQGKRGAAVR